MTIKITKLFEEGVKSLVAQHDSEEAAKLGILRAGNSGSITEDGDIISKCARLTYLRFKGQRVHKEEDDEFSKQIMFYFGRLNEVMWEDLLQRSDWEGEVLTEDTCPPVKWSIGDVDITGRPDGKLLHKDGVPAALLEYKMASSIFTVRDVVFAGKPRLSHMCQAAHYMWQIGNKHKINLPGKLIYTSPVNHHVGFGYKAKSNVYPTKPGQKFFDKVNIKQPSGWMVVPPLTHTYDLKLDSGGAVWYKWEEDTEWTSTPLDIAGIESYYGLLASLTEESECPPRPKKVTAFEGWKECDYCPLNDACDKVKNMGELIEAAKDLEPTEDK